MLSLLYFSLVRVLDGWLCGINQEAACIVFSFLFFLFCFLFFVLCDLFQP